MLLNFGSQYLHTTEIIRIPNFAALAQIYKPTQSISAIILAIQCNPNRHIRLLNQSLISSLSILFISYV